jgi:hypothetical protein
MLGLFQIKTKETKHFTNFNKKLREEKTAEMLGSRGDEYEDDCPLEYCDV